MKRLRMTLAPASSFRFAALAALSAFTALAQAQAQPAQGADQNQAPPNFLVILVDDMAWSGTSVKLDPDREDSRSDYYRTPALERLAAQSMVFTDAYSSSPLCSPSRASLLTGKSPQRLKLTDVIDAANINNPIRAEDSFSRRLSPAVPLAGLPEIHITIPEALKASNADYATAHYGKWHLGNKGPEYHGFDQSDGNTENTDGYVEDPDPKLIFGITRRSVTFLEQRQQDGRPFYLQVSHYAVHDILYALDKTLKVWQDRPGGKRHSHALFAAMTEDLDTGIGQLLNALERLGLDRNTYVVFCSDNGGLVSRPDEPGRYNNLPLARGKATVYEGGIRVPFFVRGPGVAPGTYSREPVIGWDLFPTICELAGVVGPLPSEVEGGSLATVLLNQGQGHVKRPFAPLVWHFPHYVKLRGAVPSSAIRVGDYKLIKYYASSRAALFNLKEDLEEQVDLARTEPDRVGELHALLNEHLSRVNAPMPTLNPYFKKN